MSRALRTGIALALGALVLSCTHGGTKAEVAVRLDEFSMTVRPAREDEGAVRIFVDNLGKLEHEILFARANDPSQLPVKPDGSVDVGRLQLADRLEPLQPGHYRINPNLFPGPLVLFCNLVTRDSAGRPVSHFQRGMRAKLDVKATTSATTTP